MTNNTMPRVIQKTFLRFSLLGHEEPPEYITEKGQSYRRTWYNPTQNETIIGIRIMEATYEMTD